MYVHSATNFCFAALDTDHALQIEDLKSYFEDDVEDDGENGSPEMDEVDVEEMLIYPRGGAPRNRDELIANLPEKRVADRLITRYFESMSPSQRKSFLYLINHGLDSHTDQTQMWFIVHPSREW